MSNVTQILEVKDFTERAAWGVVRELIEHGKAANATVTITTAEGPWDLVIATKKTRAARKKTTRGPKRTTKTTK